MRCFLVSCRSAHPAMSEDRDDRLRHSDVCCWRPYLEGEGLPFCPTATATGPSQQRAPALFQACLDVAVTMCSSRFRALRTVSL